MKRLKFILLISLGACSPITEKNDSNIIIPRIQYTGGADNASYSEAKRKRPLNPMPIF